MVVMTCAKEREIHASSAAVHKGKRHTLRCMIGKVVRSTRQSSETAYAGCQAGSRMVDYGSRPAFLDDLARTLTDIGRMDY